MKPIGSILLMICTRRFRSGHTLTCWRYPIFLFCMLFLSDHLKRPFPGILVLPWIAARRSSGNTCTAWPSSETSVRTEAVFITVSLNKNHRLTKGNSPYWSAGKMKLWITPISSVSSWSWRDFFLPVTSQRWKRSSLPFQKSIHLCGWIIMALRKTGIKSSDLAYSKC